MAVPVVPVTRETRWAEARGGRDVEVNAMDLPAGLLPQPWIWLGHALYLPVLALALRRVPWERVRHGETLNVFLGTWVGLIALWCLRAGISPGLSFHVLGATLLTLMFGWPLAVVGSGLVLLALTLNGASGWETFSWNALLMGVIPATLSQGMLRLAEKRLPLNFFVYVLIDAFLAAGLAMGATTLSASVLLGLSGAYPFARLGPEYLAYLPLMVFPEAMVTGLLMTMLVGFRPQWVSSFDDARYLEGR
jgi:uncharacterized membrane protein